MAHNRLLTIVMLISSFTLASPLWAWGEHGHQIVTRVAVDLFQHRNLDQSLARLLKSKEHMLAHLSNLPDIDWRNRSTSVRRKNGPTHYINWEYYHDEQIKTLKYASLSEDAQVKKLSKQSGTAPWRLVQLATLAQQGLRDIQLKHKAPRKESLKAVQEFLLHAGLLSHFAADLAQPLHNTQNFDGFESLQGGVHSFFESQLIKTQSLSFEQKVSERASKDCKLSSSSLALYKKPADANQQLWQERVFAKALAHSRSQFAKVTKLLEIDLKQAITTAGTKEPIQRPAKRKDVRVVWPHFEDFVTEQLAVGGCFVAQTWLDIYQSAGSPDLSFYQSFWYPLKVEFIDPT